jgi:hypothetical protein
MREERNRTMMHTREALGSSVAGSTANTRGRHADFQLLALAITGTVFTGFWFTYFGPIVAGAYPQSSPLVHLHGWSFFAWYLLLPLQAGLIRFRRVQIHRTLGSLSLALAAVMVISGMTVVGVRMREALASGEQSFWLVAGPAVFSTLLLFAAFYSAAFVLRRKSAYHKRLIIVASSAGMGAAAFRILGEIFGPVMWVLPASILATNLFIVVGMGLDLRREGRIHRVYLVGLPVCLALELAVFLATPTPVGQALARGLAWVGGMLGFLY